MVIVLNLCVVGGGCTYIDFPNGILYVQYYVDEFVYVGKYLFFISKSWFRYCVVKMYQFFRINFHTTNRHYNTRNITLRSPDIIYSGKNLFLHYMPVAVKKFNVMS